MEWQALIGISVMLLLIGIWYFTREESFLCMVEVSFGVWIGILIGQKNK